MRRFPHRGLHLKKFFNGLLVYYYSEIMAEKKGTSRRKSATYLFFGGALFCCLSHTRHLEHAVFWLITSQRLAMSTTCSNITLFSTRTPCDDGANKAFEYKITGCSFGGQRFLEIQKKSRLQKFLLDTRHLIFKAAAQQIHF